MDNKGFCEDITEGKFSFPIIHSIRTVPHDHRLLSILKQRTNGTTFILSYHHQRIALTGGRCGAKEVRGQIHGTDGLFRVHKKHSQGEDEASPHRSRY